MAVITYTTFRDRLRASLWPPLNAASASSEAPNQRAAHNTMFQEAMYELQKWVRSLKMNNVTIVAACATYVKNGVTVLEAPYGRYKRVYAIVAGRHDDPVYYNQTSYDEILRWSNLIMPFWTQPPLSTPPLELGFRYTSEEADSVVGRARSTPVYALNEKRLHLAPWIQHYEEVVIEWSGERRTWADADTLDDTYWTPDVEMAIKSFVRWKHEIQFGCLKPSELRDLKQQYDDALAEAIWQDDERLKIHPNPDPEIISRDPSAYELEDDLY